nr:hypothetical protein [Tanacetum cinerariifolium]
STLEADLRQYRVEDMGYGIADTCDEIVESMTEITPTTFEGVNQKVTELATTIRQDTEEFQVLIDKGVADVMASRDTDRSTNGDDNHNSRAGVRRQAPPARECTYQDFMKCKPLYFKGIEGVVELTQCHDSGTCRRIQVSTVRECTYTDLLKCHPMNFKGTEGV